MEHRPAPGAADARRTPMNPNFLDFEQPIADLQAKIEELRLVGNDNALNISDEISRLQDKSSTLTETIFGNLSSWQISQLSRHPRRPYTLDYIEHIFTEFDELHGDRHFSDDAAIVGGTARLDGQPVMVIGHQKGREVREKVRRNFGMPRPEGYRKACRLMEMAERSSCRFSPSSTPPVPTRASTPRSATRARPSPGTCA